jgi:hypothetical protein
MPTSENEPTTNPATARSTPTTSIPAYCSIPSHHTDHLISVDAPDVQTLEPKAQIAASIVNYELWSIANTYFELRIQQPIEFTFLPTVLWYLWSRGNMKAAPATSGTVNPITSKFIAMPIEVHEHHYILVIICYASDLVGPRDSTPRTFAVVFDSSVPNQPYPLFDRHLKGLLTAWGMECPFYHKPNVEALDIHWAKVSHMSPGPCHMDADLFAGSSTEQQL